MNKDKNNFLKIPKIKASNDPFARLVFKDQKSPNLRPVCLKSSRKIYTCRSQDKLKPVYCLPPISPQPRNTRIFNFHDPDRSGLCTPYFNQIEKSLKNLGNQTQIEDSICSKHVEKNSDIFS